MTIFDANWHLERLRKEKKDEEEARRKAVQEAEQNRHRGSSAVPTVGRRR